MKPKIVAWRHMENNAWQLLTSHFMEDSDFMIVV